MNDQATIPTIKTEAKFFDTCAKYGIAKFVHYYSADADFTGEEQEFHWLDESGNEIEDLPATLQDAAIELADNRVRNNELENVFMESRRDGDVDVTFDIKDRNVILEGHDYIKDDKAV